MNIYDVKINGLVNPIGYELETVVCSFKVADSESKRPKGMSIEVSETCDFSNILYQKEGVWINSLGEKLEIELEAYKRYYIRVKVMGDAGDSAESDVAFFETAKMGRAWLADWVGMEPDDKFHPEIYRQFLLADKVKNARLYICGMGVFEAVINGKQVHEDYLPPFINDYQTGFQYMTYDITEYLREENEIVVRLGNGWYKGRFGEEKCGLHDKPFSLIAELRFELENGEIQVVKTDETWRYRQSFVILSDIYDGEKQDYTILKEENNVSKPVVKQEPDINRLMERYSMPVKPQECLKVKEVIKTPAGETVLDFGQNFAGFVEFESNLPYGEKVLLEFGEVLQQGNFYNDNYRTAKAQFEFISDGKNRKVRPSFTFFGFRYVRVTGATQKVSLESFCGRAVYSDLERTGYLQTSDEKINRLYENTVWGLKSNFLDMPTDCPQRDERLGWTGDAQVFAPTASFHYDTRSFYHKYLKDLRYDQLRNKGMVAQYLPNAATGQCSSVWGDSATFIPMVLYEYYGDTEALREHYPLMKDWVDYIDREDQKHNRKHLFDFGFHFGDWLALDGKTPQSAFGGTDSYYIASVYYYASALKVKQAAEVIGKREDMLHYQKLAQKIKAAILQEYFTPSGRLAVDTQTGYLISLKFEIYHSREKIIEGLKRRMELDNYRIKCGFVGATMMCQVLAESGMEDLAYELLFYEGFPGWMRQVNLGATTIWERWNSLLDDGTISGTSMNSLNHYSYGSVMEFAYRYILGIQAETAGFKEAVIAPRLTNKMRQAKGYYDTAAGKYEVEWRIEEDGLVFVRIAIPFDCTARVCLMESGKEELQLAAGTYEFRYKPQRDFLHKYNVDTRLEQLSDDDEALAILERYVPKAAEIIKVKDEEFLTSKIGELKTMFYLGIDSEKSKEAEILLMQLGDEETISRG